MSKYQVVVGNIGTVYDGDNKHTAAHLYKQYVLQSRVGSHNRASGEAVTLFRDGEPESEHLGYQYLYENNTDAELEALISERRREDPLHCPVCPGDELYSQIGRRTDAGVDIAQKCQACGFRWYDTLTLTGAELNTDNIVQREKDPFEDVALLPDDVDTFSMRGDQA